MMPAAFSGGLILGWTESRPGQWKTEGGQLNSVTEPLPVWKLAIFLASTTRMARACVVSALATEGVCVRYSSRYDLMRVV